MSVPMVERGQVVMWRRLRTWGAANRRGEPWVANEFRPGDTETDRSEGLEPNHDPQRPGTRTIEHLVRGTGQLVMTDDSVKGGKAVNPEP